MNICLLGALGALISLIIGIILYKIFIPVLRKVKLGQKILEIGPSWHKCKEGTPNLGGLFFFIAFACAVAFELIFGKKYLETEELTKLLTALGLAFVSGLIGFADDYVKLFKKRNKGLSATQKLILQFASVGAYLFCNAYFCGYDTVIDFPWGASVDFGIFYYIVMLLAITYIINCANLTDGIDGLAGSIALLICITFTVFGMKNGSFVFSAPASAFAGALLAFLIFNFHPAKIFMGDTGSLFIGGFAVGLVMLTNCEFLLVPISLIWIIEGVSVVLQVLSFKLTGKRIFKMAPIHHHFEKCSWSEVKIVLVFSLVTAIFCGLTYWLLTL